MIISKDLRIGNYLLKDGKIVEVAVINSDNTIRVWNEEKTNTLGCFCFRLKDFEPIPLTEEWLLKFGFLYNGWNWDFQSYRFHAQGKNDRGEFYNTEFGIRKNKEVFNISFKIQYVHELQNLYFSLTGKELTIC